VKEIYQDGEEFFVDEDYKEAIFYFLQVTEKGYINPNLQYKIGVCYLNIPGEEFKAVSYLEEGQNTSLPSTK
jgi:TPR repeat protein